ncbi:hypothetical protein [Acetobacterium sp. K1/6]|uniref:hypothetical protein n=1 Tax=Acetobacterium sp. K1/6 TaxID=3055467 RepID=UPI002ACA3BD8|nr:hypothetical protein [Acetobacterium sp. K1/6]MDZ5724705.1 hypothetical protein [Acetobacterium sp. K1/6]
MDESKRQLWEERFEEQSNSKMTIVSIPLIYRHPVISTVLAGFRGVCRDCRDCRHFREKKDENLVGIFVQFKFNSILK